jgi:hypothetical protein
MQFSTRQTRGYGRKTAETRRLAATENPPRRPRGAEVPPSASSLRTPRADTTGSRALVLVCVAKQARANELITEGDGYTFIADPRSPDLRHTSKRGRHLCYCGNE